MKVVAKLHQKSPQRELGGDTMTILTGALIYVAGMVGLLMFFRHVRSCDDYMKEAFLEALAEKQHQSKNSPLVRRAG
jgi:hypothetical protein